MSTSEEDKNTMSYGSIDSKEDGKKPNGDETSDDTEEALLSSFQESDMLYVKDRPLTKAERWRKGMATILPIIVGVVVVYLFVCFSLRAVSPIHTPAPPSIPSSDHYSSEKGDSGSSSKNNKSHRGPPIESPTFPPRSTKGSGGGAAPPSSFAMPSSPSPPSSSSSTSSSGSGGSSDPSACSSNKACAKLELDGDCCPTYDGVMLGCCD